MNKTKPTPRDQWAALPNDDRSIFCHVEALRRLADEATTKIYSGLQAIAWGHYVDRVENAGSGAHSLASTEWMDRLLRYRAALEVLAGNPEVARIMAEISPIYEAALAQDAEEEAARVKSMQARQEIADKLDALRAAKLDSVAADPEILKLEKALAA